jgi:hypothetical protein
MTVQIGGSRWLPALWLAAGLAACTSSPEVRELAEKTAANTATLSAAIESMSQQSHRLAERRAANAARLAAATAQVKSSVELDRALLQQSGDSASLTTLTALQKWSEQVRQIEASAAVDEAALIQAILARRTEIEGRAKALSEVAALLASLAKKESLQDRAQFLLAYGQQVQQEVKAKQKAADEAIKAGEQKLSNTEAASGMGSP